MIVFFGIPVFNVVCSVDVVIIYKTTVSNTDIEYTEGKKPLKCAE